MADRARPLQRARRWLLSRTRYDVRPIVAGVVVTVAFTVVFHFAWQVVRTEGVRQWVFDLTGTYYQDADPVGDVQFLGGLVGGAVAGRYTASSWIDGGVNGLLAGLVGVGVIYVAWAVVRLLEATLGWGMVFPPPAIEVLVFPLVWLLPFFLLNIPLGFVGGVIGHRS